MTDLTYADALRLRGLHGLARIALRVTSPARARVAIAGIGRPLAFGGGVEAARAAARAIHPAGTCLSRAITVAAVFPGAQVVIGVDPWAGANLAAHAWVELDGTAIDTMPSGRPLPDELARL